MFQPCFLVPVYNHSETLDQTLSVLARHDLACFVVDDGSDTRHAETIERVCQGYSRVNLARHAGNRGKGAAVQSGLTLAGKNGFSHAFQIDADVQHDLTGVQVFLAAARLRPGAIILGQPVFDHTVPLSRRLSRYLTHVWVWINTLSFDIADAMCGFRVYPLAPTLAVLADSRIGHRMEFDIEILVRMHWSGIPVVTLPVITRYPEAGRSHFRPVQDNVLISVMHTRLFFGMLFRLPGIFRKRFQGSGRNE